MAECDPVIDLRGGHLLAWNPELRPLGEGTFEKEPFEEWWSRNCKQLSHLHPLIVQQWVYRHWKESPFCNLPLDRLTWREERWSTGKLLIEVCRSDPPDERALGHDRELYGVALAHREPMVTMRATGTWDIPPIVIETPNGAMLAGGPDEAVRLALIEGHMRIRCLAAFQAESWCAAEHDVFVIGLDR